MEEEYTTIKHRSTILLFVFIAIAILLFTFLITVFLTMGEDRKIGSKISIIKIEQFEVQSYLRMDIQLHIVKRPLFRGRRVKIT